MTVCRLAVARHTVFLTVVAFAAFSRCYQYTVLAVRREYAMKSDHAPSLLWLTRAWDQLTSDRGFDLDLGMYHCLTAVVRLANVGAVAY